MGTPYILVTADYEIFFGPKTGTVESCMITPTEFLRETCRSFGAKMTVFVDILFYRKLCEEGKRFRHLLEEADLIKRQIHAMVQEGHEIALHIHPHWLDATYERDHWVLPLQRYRLHHLNRGEDPSSWETLLGCFTLSRSLLESLVQEAVPNYRVSTFRAGGFCLQPFRELREAMKSNGLFIDSSVFPGGVCHTKELAFDFRNCPEKPFWHFEEEVTEEIEGGSFLEIPIPALPIPGWRRISHAWLRRQGEPWVRYGDGETMAVPDASFRVPRWKLLARPFHTSVVYLNYECMTTLEMRYLFSQYFSRFQKNEKLPVVFLGHPKVISERSLRELSDFLKWVLDRYQGVFGTLRDFALEAAAAGAQQTSPYAGAGVL